MNIRRACFGLLIVGVVASLPFVGAMAVTSSKDFIKGATIGGQFEISSSRVALQKSQNNEVRQFAQHMVDDHTQIASQLKEVTSSADTSMKQPVPPSPHLDAKHQKMLDKLNDASADDFDKKYIKAQIAAHNEAVMLFRAYAKDGDNDALRGFAAKMLPTLEQHQQDAEALQSSY